MGFCSGSGFWGTGAYVVQCTDYKTPWTPLAYDNMMPGISGTPEFSDEITGEMEIN